MTSQPTQPVKPTAEAVLQQAKTLHQQGELEKAGILYDTLLTRNPTHVDLLYFSGIAYVMRREYPKAIERLKRAVAVSPHEPLLHHNLGVAYLGAEQDEAARQQFDETVRLQPDNAEAHYYRGRIFSQQNDISQATRALETALRLNPKHVSAHAWLASTLRTINVLPLAQYHERLADHYANRVYDPHAHPPQHTFFLDRDKAWHTAHQGAKLNTNLQMCYHIGAPFPDAPPNLIHMPRWDRKTVVAFFADHPLCTPTVVDFDPNKEEERVLAGQIATHFFSWAMALPQKTRRLHERCLQTRPTFIPGQPLRVWLYSSRFTVVMRYNMRDLAKAFEALGCEAVVSQEANNLESLYPHHHLQSQADFNPHIVIAINRVLHALPPDVFSVYWWQDLNKALMDKQPLPWRERGSIFSISRELDTYLEACGAPRVQRRGFCYHEDIFRDFNHERKPKVVLAASSHRPMLVNKCPNSGVMIAALEAFFEAGEPLTDEALTGFSKQFGYSERDIYWYAWSYVVRDTSTRWLCALSEEMGIEVEIYGRDWALDPVVRPFFKGELPHGPAVAELYNSARYALSPHPFDLHSQRLTESAACGAIPLVYDGRYRSEDPTWRDSCLWYRTKEDMRACLTGPPPPEAPHTLSQGRSYTDFARHILSEVAAQIPELKR